MRRSVKILHLASSNRWTGATAPALAEVEALRQSGVDAHFAYVGGNHLEAKVRSAPYAHPLIEKKQNPITLSRSLDALAGFASRNGIAIVHAHLTWDHLLAVLLCRRMGSLRVVRTFHSRRTLRREPFTRFLLRRTSGVAVVNEAFLASPAVAAAAPLFTPPPVDHEVFQPSGLNAREQLGISSEDRVVGVIGKLAPDRGFEQAFSAFAILRRAVPRARLVVIGQGPHRPVLESLARGLAVEVVWAGYQEPDLPDYFRALDVMLFTQTGSDEGHRAVSEAMACGVPVACYPMPGIRPLLGEVAGRLIASSKTPEAVATVARSVLERGDEPLRQDCVGATSLNSFDASATRLIGLYERLH